MIEIKKTGICDNCPYADVEIAPLFASGGIYELYADCKHSAACNRILAMCKNGYAPKEGNDG